jgi:hypothetical protein
MNNETLRAVASPFGIHRYFRWPFSHAIQLNLVVNNLI